MYVLNSILFFSIINLCNCVYVWVWREYSKCGGDWWCLRREALRFCRRCKLTLTPMKRASSSSCLRGLSDVWKWSIFLALICSCYIWNFLFLLFVNCSSLGIFSSLFFVFLSLWILSSSCSSITEAAAIELDKRRHLIPIRFAVGDNNNNNCQRHFVALL